MTVGNYRLGNRAAAAELARDRQARRLPALPAAVAASAQAAPPARPATPAPNEPEVVAPSKGMRLHPMLLAPSTGPAPRIDPAEMFMRPTAPRGMFPPGIAMDHAGLPANGGTLAAITAWGMQSALNEGLVFPGYPYLAQLAQRPEYRRAVEIRAEHMTRKWIKISGPDEKRLKRIREKLDGPESRGGLNARAKFREAAEKEGFFGRSHLFCDFGDWASAREVATPLVIDERKVSPKRPIKRLTLVEPMWAYPGLWDSTNPLSPAFYKPSVWYAYGRTVHASRFLTFVSNEVPDMLKPSYAFGGLSMSQMGKPYVDNWLETRQSVNDLVQAFSQMVLSTDLSSILGGGCDASSIDFRVDYFNQTRDNRGTMVIDKATEEFSNVSVPLSSLDKLQAQAQEHMSSVWGIPLVVYLGVTPSGLNASSDGEIRTFYADIKAGQEATFGPALLRLLDIVQLSLDGKIDPEVTFEFVDLWETSEMEQAEIRKTEAETDAAYVNMGAISNEEVRERLREQEGGQYHGVDLSGEAPEPDDDDSPDDKDPGDE